MATAKSEIREWLEHAPKDSTHMAVVCDTYDWEDFPVYVSKDENVHAALGKYERGENMTKLMEVYNLAMDHERQLNSPNVFNY